MVSRGSMLTHMHSVFDCWTAHQQMVKYQQRLYLDSSSGSTLVYPEHPFPPSLCEAIPRSPTGFRDLALSRKLSLQIMAFLCLTLEFAGTSGKEDIIVSMTADAVLIIATLTTLERVLAAALGTYNVYAERNLRPPNPICRLYIQSHFTVLAENLNLGSCDPDALEWACLMLKATTEKGSNIWRWADRQLRRTCPNECRQRELSRAFLPVPQAFAIEGRHVESDNA